MRITAPPGVLSDMPVCDSAPFWYASSNVRWSMQFPETVGLAERIAADGGGFLSAALSGEPATIYSDQGVVATGHGDFVTIFDLSAGTSVQLDMTTAGSTGGSGRWWFAATEDELICARSNLTGDTFAISRTDNTVQVIPNAPAGGLGGGVVKSILVKAGTESFGGDDLALVVRWSARSTDPSSSGDPVAGPFGFEDWTPSDVNASGEIRLSVGSTIVGGGSTSYGFMVWTDAGAVVLAPRSDVYVFSEQEISANGLLSSSAWCEGDGRVWWLDRSMTLNVFDGGSSRRIQCPIRRATVEQVDPGRLDFVTLSSQQDFDEIHIHYLDVHGRLREAVYNYALDCWYPFDLDRLGIVSGDAERKTLGIRRDGFLLAYDIREATAYDMTVPAMARPQEPASGPCTVEPFDFFLMSNRISGDNATMTSVRSRKVFVPQALATAVGQGEPEPRDQISVSLQSYGTTDIRERPRVDVRMGDAGQQLFGLRGGGKFVQYAISGSGFRSMLRFGPIDVESDLGGEK